MDGEPAQGNPLNTSPATKRPLRSERRKAKNVGISDSQIPGANQETRALEAVRIVTDNILAHFEVVPIGKEDYREALNVVGNGGWSGAKIYDALLLRCAARCTVERIYTFNLGDFKQLAPASLQGIICAP